MGDKAQAARQRERLSDGKLLEQELSDSPNFRMIGKK